jgi:hypothetical protein
MLSKECRSVGGAEACLLFQRARRKPNSMNAAGYRPRKLGCYQDATKQAGRQRRVGYNLFLFGNFFFFCQ